VKRVLFVAERVTLAQVVRLVTLARALDREHYEVHFACSHFDELCFRGSDFVRHEIFSLTEADLFRSIERGKRLYDERTLERYVEEERALLTRIRPELVVGDLRWSLSVSAPSLGVPHAALINAYMSPFAVRDAMPMPDHPIVALLGVRLAERYFPRAAPRVFSHFASPVNRLRRRFGLPEVGSLLEVLTAADHVLYPDVPLLVPALDLPDHHRYLGPVFWEPDVAPPADLEALGRERPLVYVTLGSSGNLRALPAVLEGLAQLPVDALLATAGRELSPALPDNVRAVAYVPGAAIASRAAAVLCNGGSSSGYQALAAGAPAVGVAHNLDQYACMTAIQRHGAGVLLRSGNLGAVDVRAAVERVIVDPSYRARAAEVAREFAHWDSSDLFRQFVDSVTHPSRRSSRAAIASATSRSIDSSSARNG
jgi:UDP:flavonoid glycosyltransferase YjiC (YdhE family)